MSRFYEICSEMLAHSSGTPKPTFALWSRRKFGVLGKVVSDDEPRCLAAHKDMALGPRVSPHVEHR